MPRMPPKSPPRRPAEPGTAPKRLALVIAADQYLDPGQSPHGYAEASAAGLAKALAGAGYDAAGVLTLTGAAVTRAVVGSRLRRLAGRLQSGEAVLVAFVGRALVDDDTGKAYFALADTLLDDVPGTGLAVAELVAALEASKVAQVTLMLDVANSDELDAELKSLLADSPKTVAVVSTSPGEEANSVTAVKSTAFTHLVREALEGKAATLAGPDRAVTAAKLARYLDADMPRLLRRHFDAMTRQTVTLYGEQNAAETIAELPATAQTGSVIGADRLKRVVFRSESRGRVKDMAGFRKTFNVPDNAGASNRKFIAKIATQDIRTDLDEIVTLSRDHLGYKRKDIDLISDGDGVGTVRTPDFEYAVSVELDAEDPSKLTWRREIGQFTDPNFVRSSGFDSVFGQLLDQLRFEFARPIDVSALIDRLEDAPPAGLKLGVSADGKSCEMTLAGFTGRVIVTPDALTVRGRGGAASGLLDQLLAFLANVGPIGEPLMLG